MTLQREEIAASKDGFDRYKIEAAKDVASARSDSDTKIAVARDEASAEIAKANARSDEANARTKEAELRLEQLRAQMASRHIKRDEFVKLLEGKPKLPVEIMFAKDDGEAFQLSLEIRNSLRAANWTANEPIPIPAVDHPSLSQLPSAMAVGGQPDGVTVAAYSISAGETLFEIPGIPRIETPYTALASALMSSLGQLSSSGGHLNRPKDGTLRVVVGSKRRPFN